MDFKVKKRILIGFEFFNNFLIYILENKKVINIKNINIKKNLKYLDKYKD